MNINVILGYILGIGGLIILARNAYVYLSGSEASKISSGAAIIFSVIGAILIRKDRPAKNSQRPK